MIIKKRYVAPVRHEGESSFHLLEIETTGLMKGRDRISTIALAQIKDGALHTKQWIATTPDDEGHLLVTVLPVLQSKTLCVFHAGFLLPFLEARAEKHGLSFAFEGVRDVRQRFLDLKPFFPLPRTSRAHIAEALELPLPVEPNGEDVARITRRLYKKYEPELVERIAAHNLLHVEALYGMDLFLSRKEAGMTREQDGISIRLQTASFQKDFIEAKLQVRGAQRTFFETDTVLLSLEETRATLRVETTKGMITQTMPCHFTEIWEYPKLSDRSGFRVPEGVLLLHVEDRFLPDALLDLMEAVLTLAL